MALENRKNLTAIARLLGQYADEPILSTLLFHGLEGSLAGGDKNGITEAVTLIKAELGSLPTDLIGLGDEQIKSGTRQLDKAHPELSQTLRYGWENSLHVFLYKKGQFVKWYHPETFWF